MIEPIDLKMLDSIPSEKFSATLIVFLMEKIDEVIEVVNSIETDPEEEG